MPPSSLGASHDTVSLPLPATALGVLTELGDEACTHSTGAEN
jgi:hypothetical protein